MFDPKIFKAYDIRGIYGKELDDDLAYRLGRAVVVHFGAKKIAVGRDVESTAAHPKMTGQDIRLRPPLLTSSYCL